MLSKVCSKFYLENRKNYELMNVILTFAKEPHEGGGGGFETPKIKEKHILQKKVKSFHHSLRIYTQRAFYHSFRS